MSNSFDAAKITFFKPDDVTKYLARVERTDNNGDFCDEIADNGDEVFEIRLGDEVVGLAYLEDDEKEASATARPMSPRKSSPESSGIRRSSPPRR